MRAGIIGATGYTGVELVKIIPARITSPLK